jgi:hypothetical protein
VKSNNNLTYIAMFVGFCFFIVFVILYVYLLTLVNSGPIEYVRVRVEPNSFK